MSYGPWRKATDFGPKFYVGPGNEVVRDTRWRSVVNREVSFLRSADKAYHAATTGVHHGKSHGTANGAADGMGVPAPRNSALAAAREHRHAMAAEGKLRKAVAAERDQCARLERQLAAQRRSATEARNKARYGARQTQALRRQVADLQSSLSVNALVVPSLRTRTTPRPTARPAAGGGGVATLPLAPNRGTNHTPRHTRAAAGHANGHSKPAPSARKHAARHSKPRTRDASKAIGGGTRVFATGSLTQGTAHVRGVSAAQFQARDTDVERRFLLDLLAASDKAKRDLRQAKALDEHMQDSIRSVRTALGRPRSSRSRPASAHAASAKHRHRHRARPASAASSRTALASTGRSSVGDSDAADGRHHNRKPESRRRVRVSTLPADGAESVRTAAAVTARMRYLSAIAGSDVAARLRRWQSGASRGNPLVRHDGAYDAAGARAAPVKRSERLRAADRARAEAFIDRVGAAGAPSCDATRGLHTRQHAAAHPHAAGATRQSLQL